MIATSASLIKRLSRSTSGVAMTEFALAFPFILGVGLMGVEVANRVLVQMKVAQLANQIADNASRIGEQDVLEDRRIFESEINDLFYGAELQGGNAVDLYQNGRVILSSLEVVPGTTDQQYIHWQRCVGTKNHTSSFGVSGDGADANDFPGMGPAGEEVIAFDGGAVMFVVRASTVRFARCSPALMSTMFRHLTRSRKSPLSTVLYGNTAPSAAMSPHGGHKPKAA